MKVFGHPVHMILIHFPSALFPVDLMLSGFGFFTGQSVFYVAAFYVMVIAVVTGWLAVMVGAVDLMHLKESELLLRKTLVHGAINICMLMVYSTLAFSSYRQYPELVAPNEFMLAFKLLLVVVMSIGNYFGAELVLKYGVGLLKK